MLPYNFLFFDFNRPFIFALMKRHVYTFLLWCVAGLPLCRPLVAQPLPSSTEILNKMVVVNDYFMQKYADYTKESFVGRQRPSNIWTRGVYYEGLLALHAISPREDYYEYTFNWAEFHKWGMRHGPSTRNADDQCCGQAYLTLYEICPTKPEMIKDIKASMDMLVNTPKVDDWTWIDAIQMAMPVLAKLGVLTEQTRYFDKMWEMYSCTRNKIGKGLFNAEEGLWWRDASFTPPYTEPNGEDCYWSRGNGWVYAALVRVLDVLPEDDPHRQAYINDFLAMSEAIRKCVRPDGFWNVSLHDPSHFGGKETTGTSLFVYGMAWGIRQGLLDRATYWPLVVNGWNALATESATESGFLAYVQGTGKEPKDSQPVTATSMPDFEDFGIGCFLLAGSEVYKLQ